MIISGYTLDLYCDHPFHPADPSGAQYVGELGSECRKEARKDGWRLGVLLVRQKGDEINTKWVPMALLRNIEAGGEKWET